MTASTALGTKSSETSSARLLPTIADAVWNERCLEIRYKRPSGVVPRKVQPLGLVLKGGAWYLVAQIGEQPRTYRVSNILDLSVTEERFERPTDFDSRAVLDLRIARL